VRAPPAAPSDNAHSSFLVVTNSEHALPQFPSFTSNIYIIFVLISAVCISQ